jgi:hypothetical protein
MGWGRTLFLGDIGNRLDIEDTEQDVRRLKRELTGSYHKDMGQDTKIDRLVKENAELKLYLAAIIRLLTTNGTISPEELEIMVKAVDAEDGAADGQYGGSMV